jgi:hypothetical protein
MGVCTRTSNESKKVLASGGAAPLTGPVFPWVSWRGEVASPRRCEATMLGAWLNGFRIKR